MPETEMALASEEIGGEDPAVIAQAGQATILRQQKAGTTKETQEHKGTLAIPLSEFRRVT